MADPKSYRPQGVPDLPGVYRFFDEENQVIYVGKAKSLKNRLNSYFQSALTEKTSRMVHAATRVDWTVVNTEIEALQLEFTWIKSESPRFNIQFRDDKSYPYLAISIKDEFPRIFITRRTGNKSLRYFGPFTHAWALRSTFDVIQRIYPVRSCTQTNFNKAAKTKRQCLLGDIGRCAAPCIGSISSQDHKKLIDELITFLERGPDQVIKQLAEEMKIAARGEEFERAAKIRDQIEALKTAGDSASAALSPDLTGDFFARYDDITHSAVAWFTVKMGRITSSRTWVVNMKEIPEEASFLTLALQEIYRDSSNENEQRLPPNEIYLSEEIDDLELASEWLSRLAERKISILTPQRGEKYEIIQMARRSARYALVQFLSKRSADSAVSGGALEEIAQLLQMDEIPLRIECFDISNIQGTNIVASMVVFEDGQPKKSEYRRFAITDPEIRDDFSSMAHVISRRFKRYLLEREIDFSEINESGGAKPKFAYPPQLIIVDGGKGQVNAASSAMEELGITGITLVGLAKRLEEVFLPNHSKPIIFPRHSEALYLIQRIRDEAHRFAITFHRSKRSKLMLQSLLDEIPAMGEARSRALLERFGSVAALRKASVTEIAATPGIGARIAGLIADHLAEFSQLELDTQTGELKDTNG
jgi:excinuclease ABC subunit C